MKKKLIIILLLILCITLVGCKKKSKEEVIESIGGWKLDKTAKKMNIDSKAEKAYKTAVKSYKDGNLELISLLGTQVVSGTNYMFLCKETKDKTINYYFVTVYYDLKGNAKITKKSRLKIEDYVRKDISYNDSIKTGGWTVYKNIGSSKLKKSQQEIFNKAIENESSKYKPICLLATQLVAGENYAFLALNESNETINIITVYKDIEDNIELTSIAYVDLADF